MGKFGISKKNSRVNNGSRDHGSTEGYFAKSAKNGLRRITEGSTAADVVDIPVDEALSKQVTYIGATKRSAFSATCVYVYLFVELSHEPRDPVHGRTPGI